MQRMQPTIATRASTAAPIEIPTRVFVLNPSGFKLTLFPSASGDGSGVDSTGVAAEPFNGRRLYPSASGEGSGEVNASGDGSDEDSTSGDGTGDSKMTAAEDTAKSAATSRMAEKRFILKC